MKNRGARVLQFLKIAALETLRLPLPCVQFLKVQCEQTQHIDHRRPANQVQRAYRVLSFALGEEGTSAAIDQRRSEGKRRVFENRTTSYHKFCRSWIV